MTATTCPSREELFDYAVGRLSDEVSENVAEHLESCQSCQAGLATFDDADDTLVARLRLPAEEDPYQGESQCRVAMARARAVGGRGSLPAPEPEAAASHSQLLGTLGEYQLLEKLGHGGMGTVYRAVHTKLDRVVALKVLPKGRADDQQAIARFEREMKAIGRLDHPNIVRAYDAREIEGKPVLIMEYVAGQDLGKLVRRLGPLPVADACELARQAALGLQYAHENGLVHRDVKPSNLMLTPEGEVKILDLGLARFPRAEAAGEEMTGSGRVAGVSRSEPPTPQVSSPTPDDMTGSGQAMGTADYMAPEQASDSHAVDIRADIYSLGCTLYKLLTGRPPFSGEKYRGSFEKMTAHVRETVPPIREFQAEIPEELGTVLDRMLAKDPDERYATPAEVADALAPFCIDCDLPGLLVRAEEAEAAAAEPPSPALPRQGAPGAAEPAPTPLPFWRRGRPLAAAIGLMLFSLGAGVALGIIITIHRNGQTTSVELPDGTSAKLDSAGNLSVTPPGETGKPAPSVAKSDLEAIQGTWEVVNASTETGGEPLLLPGRSGLTEQDLIGTEVVITGDALKVQGKNVVSLTYKYQLNSIANPRMIDLEAGGRVLWGVYELTGDQLKICSTPAIQRQSSPPHRPTQFWAGYRSGDDLIVLRRVGEAVVTAGEKAIQGTWEIVSSETRISESAKAGASVVADSMWPSGETAIGRKVEISRHDFKLKVPWPAGAGGAGLEERRMEYGYAIDPSRRPKTIDFTWSHTYPGLYQLDGDELRICASIAWFGGYGYEDRRPRSIPAKPGEDQVLIVMRPVHQPAVVPPAKVEPAPSAAKSDAEVIQGTWEIVSATTVQVIVRRAGREMSAEDVKGAKLVMTDDAVKVTGKNVTNVTYQYQLNPSADPKMIDLRVGGRVVRGIYELAGSQLKICSVTTFPGARGGERNPRPAHLWAEYGSSEELLVLRRVGEATVTADEKAIQGMWEIVRSESQISEGTARGLGRGGVSQYLWPSGAAANGRHVEINRFNLTLKPAPPGPSAAAGGGAQGYAYAIDPDTDPKTIDFSAGLGGSTYWGVYELDRDHLTICATLSDSVFGDSEGPTPKAIPAKPGEDQVLIVLRRVRATPAAPAGIKPSTGAEAAPAEVVEVQVDKNGEVRLDGRQVSVDSSAPWLAELRQRVAGGAGVRVEVRCDPEAAYRHVAALTEALQAAGVKDVSISVAAPPAAPAREEKKEATTAPAGILDLRIAPSRDGDCWAALDEVAIKDYFARAPWSPQQPRGHWRKTEQKELSGVVSSIESIESATVQYLVPIGPDARRVPLRASAYVHVKTVGSKPLDEKQVGQIQTLVAGALAGVQRERVTVTDLRTGDQFLVADSAGSLVRRPIGLTSDFRGLETIVQQDISRSLARVPGVKVTVDRRKHESDPCAVAAAVPRSYFEMLWHRRHPVANNREPGTPPQEALDMIQQDVIQRIRRHIAAQLAESRWVADASELVTVTVFEDNWSWATLEQMAKEVRERSQSDKYSFEYGWFELKTQPTADLITVTNKGKQYVLVSGQRPESMLACDRPPPRDWELKAVRGGKDQQGRPVIELEFDEVGARRLAALSEVFRGNRLAILVDDKVIATPMLDSKLTDKLQIHGDFDEAEAQRLVQLLQAGMIAAGETTSAQPAKPDESAGQPTESKGDDRPRTGGTD